MCILNRLKGFVIKDSALLKYKGNKKIVTIPDGVTKIECFAFSGCRKLCNVNIPNSVTEIHPFAFSGCVEMRDQNGLVVLQNTLFHCYYAEKVVIPDTVTRISATAFITCKDVKTITIPSSVVQIDNNPFADCADVTIYAPSNTFAEQYAKENGIPFIAI